MSSFSEDCVEDGFKNDRPLGADTQLLIRKLLHLDVVKNTPVQLNYHLVEKEMPNRVLLGNHNVIKDIFRSCRPG
jgi:hypothetical protein